MASKYEIPHVQLVATLHLPTDSPEFELLLAHPELGRLLRAVKVVKHQPRKPEKGGK
jgi:hypothetical protein